jgi:hypothetical protein
VRGASIDHSEIPSPDLHAALQVREKGTEGKVVWGVWRESRRGERGVRKKQGGNGCREDGLHASPHIQVPSHFLPIDSLAFVQTPAGASHPHPVSDSHATSLLDAAEGGPAGAAAGTVLPTSTGAAGGEEAAGAQGRS